MGFRKVFKKPDKDAEKRLRKEIDESGGLDKKDMAAMIFSAYMIFIPIALGALLVIYFMARLFLRI